MALPTQEGMLMLDSILATGLVERNNAAMATRSRGMVLCLV